MPQRMLRGLFASVPTLGRHTHYEPYCFAYRGGVVMCNQFRNSCQVWRAIQHVEAPHSRRLVVLKPAQKKAHRVRLH